MLIWTLLQDLGIRWTPAQREQRLFPVCCVVQATLSARHPGYTTPGVHDVPRALVEETREIIRQILSSSEVAPP